MGWADRFRRRRDVAKTEKVLVVLLAGGHMNHCSLTQLANECDRFSALRTHRFILDFKIIGGAAPQEKARNIACGMALASGADTLLMFDHDMIQRGWRTLRVLDTPGYDIAAPLEYMWLPADPETGRPPDARPCAFMRKPEGEVGQTAVYPAEGETCRDVDRVGSGCMAIKRRVFADPRMLLAEGCDPPAFWRNLYAPNFERLKGLDMDFCDRAKALGYRVIVNWQAEVGHWKQAVDVNEIDAYAKLQFIEGYARGRAADGLPMGEGREGGAEAGPDRGAGRIEPGNAPMAGVGVDRAGPPAAAAGP